MSIPTTISCPGCASLVRALGSSEEGVFFFCPNFDCDYINLITNDDMVECLSDKMRDDIYFELDFLKAQKEQDTENQLKNEEQKPIDCKIEHHHYEMKRVPGSFIYDPMITQSAFGKESNLTDWAFGGMIFKTMKQKG